MSMRAFWISILAFYSAGVFAGPWEFKAFARAKVHLNHEPEATSAAGVFAKASAEYPLLLLVNNECLRGGQDRLAALGFHVKHKSSPYLKIEALAARYSGPLDDAGLEALLAGEPCIAGLTDNSPVRSQSLGDPLLPNQPALTAISHSAGERFFFHPLWGIRKEVVVGVVDSGVQADHPDLAARIWRGTDGAYGFDFVNGDSDPADDYGHGTHVAGLILAQRENGIGIRGVMGDWSKLMAVKSQDAMGGGTMADVINAFRWAVDHGAEVVNLSLASRQQNQALVDALDYAVAKNVTVVVASGNDGEEITSFNFISPIGYAAGIRGVIGVGSVDADSKLRSSFSNYGPGYVEIAAPGSPGSSVGILSTFPKDQYAGINGTSMAAPQVAGAAALAAGFLKTHGIAHTPAQIEDLVLNSADQNAANQTYFGSGRALNLENLGRYIFNSTFVSGTGGFDD
jgi:hypothetical protein